MERLKGEAAADAPNVHLSKSCLLRRQVQNQVKNETQEAGCALASAGVNVLLLWPFSKPIKATNDVGLHLTRNRRKQAVFMLEHVNAS